MAEYDFEAGLERMFNQAPAYPDARQFAEAIESRLNRSSRWRTVAVSAAGIVGGLVAGSQLLGASVPMRFEQASANSVQAVDSVYREVFTQADILAQAGGSGVGLFWMISGLLIAAAVVVGAAKAFQEV